MDNKLYRVRAQLNFYCHYGINYLKITDHYIEWVPGELGGTKLTKEEAETIIRILRTHGRESHGYEVVEVEPAYELVEVEPAYVIKHSNCKQDFYYDGTGAMGTLDTVAWAMNVEDISVSFDKASAIKHQEALKTLFDLDTELVPYYEHR